MNSSGLSVIEGHWYKKWPMSIAPLVELALANSNLRATEYDYERFRLKGHFLEAVSRASRSSTLLYIACHGEGGRIQASNYQIKIDEICRAISADSSLNGVLFGVCELLTAENAQTILNETNLIWVAGYKASVDWVDSAAIDLMVINHWLDHAEDLKNGSRKLAKFLMPMSDFLWQRALQFSIYTKGRDGLVDLLEPSL